jgi:hypothetical protein
MAKKTNPDENRDAQGGSSRSTAGTTPDVPLGTDTGNTNEVPETLPKNAEEGTLVGDPKALEKAAGVESGDDRAVAISQLDEVRTESQQPENTNPTGFGENSEFTRPEDR